MGKKKKNIKESFFSSVQLLHRPRRLQVLPHLHQEPLGRALSRDKPSHVYKRTWSLAPVSMHRATTDKKQPRLMHYLLIIAISEEYSKPQQLPPTLMSCVKPQDSFTPSATKLQVAGLSGNTGHTGGSNSYARGPSINKTVTHHHL